MDLRDILEKLQGILHSHFQNVRNVLPFILHFQCFTIITLAFADLARDIDVWQEMHFDFDNTVSAASLATTALDIKAKAASCIAARLRFYSLCKNITNVIEHPGISGRIRARRPANRRLININHLVKLPPPDQIIMLTRFAISAVQITRQPLMENPVNQGTLAGPRNPSHTGH